MKIRRYFVSGGKAYPGVIKAVTIVKIGIVLLIAGMAF